MAHRKPIGSRTQFLGQTKRQIRAEANGILRELNAQLHLVSPPVRAAFFRLLRKKSPRLANGVKWLEHDLEWLYVRWLETGKTLQPRRSPSPDNIRRNAEMCRKRDADPNLWTLERLRREFMFDKETSKMKTLRAVTRILSQREKWFRLEAMLDETRETN